MKLSDYRDQGDDSFIRRADYARDVCAKVLGRVDP